MNKTLVITTIALVAVVMGFSTIAPTLQQAFAHNVTVAPAPIVRNTVCPSAFTPFDIEVPGTHPDHNLNGIVCLNTAGSPSRVTVDDNVQAI